MPATLAIVSEYFGFLSLLVENEGEPIAREYAARNRFEVRDDTRRKWR
jgi:hypothetical protein